MGNKERCRKYYYSHKERMNEQSRLYHQSHKEEQKLVAREYRRTHRDKVNKWNRNYKNKLKQEIFNLLGNRCTHCGFSDIRALQIDHVHGGGRQERLKFSNIAKYYKFILEKIKNCSKDYQILCANCNLIKRIENKEEY